MPKPVIKSLHQFTDYVGENLGRVRSMLHLGRRDAYLLALDQQMSLCWRTTVNCNCPSPEQRRDCILGAVTVEALWRPIGPQMPDLVERLQLLQSYLAGVPLPVSAGGADVECARPGCAARHPASSQFCARCGARLPEHDAAPAGGWEIAEHVEHADYATKTLTSCIDDVRCLKALDADDAFVATLFEQLVKMAAWTRQSIRPTRAARAEVRLDLFNRADVEQHLAAGLAVGVQHLHWLHDLYVNYPVTEPGIRLALEQSKRGFPNLPNEPR